MESIDLGLPSGNLWCEINLGAEKIGENGKWAAWGCLELHSDKEVAKMLKKGHTYMEVAEQTGASTATISRVNRSLNYGKDGYEIVFSRMKSMQNEKE